MTKITLPDTDRGHTPLDREFLDAVRNVADNWPKYHKMDDVDSLIGILLDEIELQRSKSDTYKKMYFGALDAMSEDDSHPHHVPDDDDEMGNLAKRLSAAMEALDPVMDEIHEKNLSWMEAERERFERRRNEMRAKHEERVADMKRRWDRE